MNTQLIRQLLSTISFILCGICFIVAVVIRFYIYNRLIEDGTMGKWWMSVEWDYMKAYPEDIRILVIYILCCIGFLLFLGIGGALQ
ncbi:hypothetical protein E4O03_03620 [Treponema sp. OMZ 792]|uniref:hypothetical protein n=1 Tax=unclassified Treponema TaxID=2638727 RepID=UPI0020A5B6BB|nr:MULTISPECIES: hypothetical protein [unclassified Treponema]UTC75817.1 hypothetical protein E4O03_03620 [Treponema sp. OMZ 792]UTC78383.1 hypothetical protein E4O04_10360 [Treponema sp. OMZ 799]UTC79817.1 hypothetical protein E4O07_03635 [Treponema sp. OMZ 798]